MVSGADPVTSPRQVEPLGQPLPAPRDEQQSMAADRRRVAGRLSLSSFWDAVDPRPGTSGEPSD